MKFNLKLKTMKTTLIFLVCMLIAAYSEAQNRPNSFKNELTENEIIPPRFCASNKVIQGEYFETIDEFLCKNVVYPEDSRNCGFYGTELIKFRVSQSGEPTHFDVINSVCKKMDEEVIKVLQMTEGMWVPATVNGQPVDMDVEVSVVFALHPSTDFVLLAKNYLKRGNQNLFEKNNPKKALRFYNMGIKLLPNNETLLAARGLCKYELGDENGAIRDWERFKTVTERNDSLPETENFALSFNAMKGYPEMMKTIKD
jgi:tetratricopeptide (TPR) repeat protein